MTSKLPAFVPVGLQSTAVPQVTRRQFLGGLLTTPLAAGAAMALAADSREVLFDLAFEVSDEGGTLSVSEVRVCRASTGASNAQPESRQVIACWKVPAAAFGPKAWFDLALSADAEARERRIVIRQARFAEAGDVALALIFARARASEARWSVAWSSNLWGATLTSPPRPFADFIAGSASLWARAATANVGVTLDTLFDGRIARIPSGASHCHVGLDRHLVWNVKSDDRKPILTSIRAQVEIRTFELAWAIGERESGSLPFLGGFAAAAISAPLETDAAGHRVVVAATPARDFRLELRRGKSPLFPRQPMTIAALHLPAAAVSVHDGQGLIAGPIAALDVVVTQANMVRSLGIVRTVLYGDALQEVFDEPGKEKERQKIDRRIASPLGRLHVCAPDLDIAAADPPQEPKEQPADEPATTQAPASAEACGNLPDMACVDGRMRAGAEKARGAAMHLFLAAVGDRIGAAASSIFVVHDRAVWRDKPHGLRRIAIDLGLLEAPTALPDTSYSRLCFDSADLRLTYEDGKQLPELRSGEYPHPSSRSFIWLGPRGKRKKDVTFAVLDLSRAKLTCARDHDLMKLRLRFNDLALIFRAERRPSIRASREDCRVLERDGVVDDNRPTLLVEFDPQHVMEEAILKPEPLPLPDVKDPADKALGRDLVVKDLEAERDIEKRVARRAAVLEAKLKELDALASNDARPNEGATAKEIRLAELEIFREFAKAFGNQAKNAGLPRDQQIYLGPYALDADAMAVARAVQRDFSDAAIRDRVEMTIRDVNAMAGSPQWQNAFIAAVGAATGEDFAAQLRREAMLEQQVPLYGAFRDFWRDGVTERRAVVGAEYTRLSLAALADPRAAEFVSDFHIGNDAREKREELRAAILADFVQVAKGSDTFEQLMGARLSGPSRLAFRINCEALAGVTAEEAGLPSGRPSSDEPACAGASATPRADEPERVIPSDAEPGNGSDNFPAIAFTFEALTDWSRHELAVTRRARKLFLPLASGVVPPLGNRAANLADLDMLRLQGFSEGSVTSEQRMQEVRALLAFGPTKWETRLEIPARIILSTAQDALWRTNRTLAAEIPSPPFVKEPERAPSHAGPWPLWSARLMVSDSAPTLRVVASPDLRRSALQHGRLPREDAADAAKHDVPRAPGAGAPPRGPWAPWFIGPEQMESDTSECADFAEKIPIPARETDPKDYRERLCNPKVTLTRPTLIDWLFHRKRLRDDAMRLHNHLFRTSLDANDRHQLVLLSSAYGLPVIGRREAVQRLGADGKPLPVDETTGGALIKESGQFEPGARFRLIDAMDGQAIWPLPLNVQELTLTALGGSFVHDTTFKPPAGADDVYGRKIFDGMSIERWQHEIVLGRDVRAEVVYKGYLMPLGHRASLVKLTERLILRRKVSGDLKAVLRQRFFIRVATPRKVYPCIGQPHQGRMWCGKVVTILTVRTPDLLDPAYAIDGTPTKDHRETLNGRIYLDDQPGLAFWPRTDITDQGLVQFDVDIDGAVSRMPLLFVDNIAATTQLSLLAAANRYNLKTENTESEKKLVLRRRLEFGGQKVTFAEESKPGDTQYPTEALQVLVHGRLSSVGEEKWTDNLANYQTTSVLEGAEQPPFYPRLESADIRLGQAERFTGGRPMSTSVQYDGYYVREGFPDSPRRKAEETAAANSADEGTPDPDDPNNHLQPDILLNLRRCVKLDMGGNGERAAAIARPNTYVIALSRSQGPLGGDAKKVTWYHKNNQAVPCATSDECSLVNSDDSLRDLAIVSNHSDGLVSLMPYFSTSGRESSSTVDPNEKGDIAPAVSRKEPTDEGELAQLKSLGNKLEVMRSYFSGDAKLLGTITLRDLLFLLRLYGVDLPQLREVIDYGSSMAESADTAANDIRTRALTPLHEAVRRLQQAWEQLDKDIVERQQRYARDLGLEDEADAGETQGKAKAKEVSLKSVYPEVSEGLSNLDGLLKAALSADRFTTLAEQLAAIYQGARTLLRALNALTSNPAERIEEAVGDSLRSHGDALRKKVAGLQSELVRKFGELGAQLKPENIATAILDQLGEGPITFFEFLLPPIFDPDALKVAVAPGSQFDLRKHVDGVLAKVRTQLTADALKPLVAALISEALGTGSRDARDTQLQRLFGDIEAAARDAVEETCEAIAAELGDSSTLRWAADHALKAYADAISALRATKAARARIDETLNYYKDTVARLATLKVHKTLGLLFSEVAKFVVEALIDFQSELSGAAGKGLTAIREYVTATFTSVIVQFDSNFDPDKFGAEVAWALTRVAERTSPSIFSFASDNRVAADFPKHGGTALTVGWLALRGQLAPLDDKELAEAIDDGYAATVSLLYHVRVAKQIDTGLPNEVPTPLTLHKWRAPVEALWWHVGEARDAAGQLMQALATALPKIPADRKVDVGALAAATNLVTGLIAMPKVAVDAIADLQKLVVDLDDDFHRRFGNGLLDFNAIKDLRERWATPAYKSIEFPPEVGVAELLEARLTEELSVKEFLRDSYATKLLKDVARREAAFQSALAQIVKRLSGLPDALTAEIQRAIVGTPFFGFLAKQYGGLYRLRRELLAKLQGLPPTLQPLRNSLIVTEGIELYQKCDTVTLEADEVEDLLWHELQTLKCLEKSATATSEQLQAMRANLSVFAASWFKGRADKAAPLAILRNVESLFRRLLKGDILAVIDLSAFREQIEDAIASLIPTRLRFGYDFESTIENPSDDNAIFQPEPGAKFGIHVNASTDLLNPEKSDFHAHGELGPFDIMLIGGLVDALRLKFGGAAFEVKKGQKARLDVIYRDFEIGSSLDFAKPLQSFLTPKDGNGVFIQPLAYRAGIEAGYGINLQTIGIGVTSFFNVILSVSAELPFDDGESLFKVSLGRMLSPFSMGVGIFAGSGFFSIFCAADGVRGFESSFEFGGGGSIGFGPLTAIARIQVGVYIRILKVDGRRTTTIFGTFFAGGTASIWIFHFATSLSVRLGSADGGAMYGEATYSFSFSLGLADFDYSVTAFHKENAIGQGGGSNQGGGGGGGGNGDDLVMLGLPLWNDVDGEERFDPYFDLELIAGIHDPYGATA